MNFNQEYEQISVHSFSGYRTNYDALKGKVVEKVAFTDKNSYDTQFFIITFTDKTFISVGVGYNDVSDLHRDEPQLQNNYILPPQCINNGNYDVHSYVDSKGNVYFEEWINILRDIGLWEFNEVDALEIIERDKQKEEEREYQNYLRLKEKFEGKK